MTIDEIIDFVAGLDGVLTLRPTAETEWPEISWGDTFFYYSPDGEIPTRTQPFATIVTKDYPGEPSSDLHRPNSFRVNIAAGKEAFIEWTGRPPREQATDVDYHVTDTVLPHPTYSSAGWLAVVDPGARTETTTRELLHTAYERARSRYERHSSSEAR
ncbi:DUF6194 family protein [Nocardia sp. NPDC057030]|uniref:DUF6194 family protein n=1 Tax=unclassified Nocardia TaxID=2637762 RepID=UPI0036361C64